MLSPLRVNTGDEPTFVIMKRSPGGAPKRPPSPLPGIRAREPVSTPAGIRTLTFSALPNCFALHRNTPDAVYRSATVSDSCVKRQTAAGFLYLP